MAKLKYTTKQAIEELFEMGSGYVLDFSNSSFDRFVSGVIGINIYKDEGYEEYCSKANKLRQIFDTEPNFKVVKLINALLNYYEDYKMKDGEILTEYEIKKINDIKKDIEGLEADGENVVIYEEVDELIQKISTRNARFNNMALDEKLKEIGNLIEYLLKDNGKFIKLNYNDISVGFVDDGDVRELRKKVQCFRHSSKESIIERGKYTEQQKLFMVEFGIIICNLIYNELKKHNS